MKLKPPSGAEYDHPVGKVKLDASTRARAHGQGGGGRSGEKSQVSICYLSSQPERTSSFALISLGSSFSNDLARPIWPMIKVRAKADLFEDNSQTKGEDTNLPKPLCER